MEAIHATIVFAHIVTGSLSLGLFWIPCLSRKGGSAHRKFGSWYLHTMTFTAISGVISSSMVLAMPLTIYPNVPSHYSSAELFIANIQMQYLFLLMLSLLIWSNLRQAKAVLRVKQQHQALRRAGYLWLPACLILVAVLALYRGLQTGNILAMIFGPIALLNGIGILRYAMADAHPPKTWLKEHIGHILGSGIGAYTAFFAFGGRTLFAQWPELQLASWILPSLIGVPFALWQSRKYTQVNHALRSRNRAATKQH